jgi:hypothetical protein
MKVAWHEVPGKSKHMIRPVGYGVILSYAYNLPVFVPIQQRCFSFGTVGEIACDENRIIPFPTGRDSFMAVIQALRARLRSFGPSGTSSSLSRRCALVPYDPDCFSTSVSF